MFHSVSKEKILDDILDDQDSDWLVILVIHYNLLVTHLLRKHISIYYFYLLKQEKINIIPFYL